MLWSPNQPMAAVLEGGEGAELNTGIGGAKNQGRLDCPKFFHIHNLAHTNLGFTCVSVLQHVKCLNECINGTVNCA